MIKGKRRFRRLWYYKQRNLKYYRISLCISIAVLVFVFSWSYAFMNLFPRGQKEFEGELYNKINIAIKDEVGKNNNELVIIEKDYSGAIISVKSDNDKLTKLSTIIDKNLKNLLVTKDNEPYIPMRVALFDPIGFKINIGGARITDAQISYNSKFLLVENNNTRLIIYLNANITYEYLLGKKECNYEFIIWDGLIKG